MMVGVALGGNRSRFLSFGDHFLIFPLPIPAVKGLVGNSLVIIVSDRCWGRSDSCWIVLAGGVAGTICIAQRPHGSYDYLEAGDSVGFPSYLTCMMGGYEVVQVCEMGLPNLYLVYSRPDKHDPKGS